MTSIPQELQCSKCGIFKPFSSFWNTRPVCKTCGQREWRERCAICSCAVDDKRNYRNCETGQFAVDHDHENGQVRGLLCSSCNHSLGQMEDNTEFLQRAIDYLLRFDFE